MELILIAKTAGAQGPVIIGWRGVVFSLIASAGVAALLVYGGFKIGQISPDPTPGISEARIEQQLAQQSGRVEGAIRNAEKNVNALALKLGEMQAHLIRLDALGERLVEMAQLDPQEFDFSQSPARGGPNNASALESQSVPDFVASLEALAGQLNDRSPKLTALEQLLMTNRLQAEVHPTGRPVSSGYISSGFGYRTDPLSGKKAFHSGLDFAGRSGSKIIAVAAGVVISSRYRAGLGNVVELHHGNGYVTRYAHNKRNLVAVGDTVKKGQTIAMMGSSGRSTGPHVHFEVLHNGKSVNPIQYVRANP